MKNGYKKFSLHNRMRHRITASALAFCMAFSLMPAPVFAAQQGQTVDRAEETGGLCEHHTEHTSECGYTEALEGSPCIHITEGKEHSEDCYKTIEDCVHEHTADCYDDAAAEPASDSDAGDPVNCTHVCSEDSGCIIEKLACPHEKNRHDDECGYAAEEEGTSCTFVCQRCEGVLEESTAVKAVQDMFDRLPEIDALPDPDSENFSEYLDTLKGDVKAARRRYDALSGEEKTMLTSAGLKKLEALEKLLANVPVLLAEGIGISTENDLIAMADSGTYYLLNDIELTKAWTPIPQFSGTLDGAGYTIKGLTVKESEPNSGLIKKLQSTGTIKNLNFQGTIESTCNSSGRSGGIAGENYGTITGCTFSGKVWNSEGDNHALGGICGINKGAITGCANNGEVAGMSKRNEVYVGGIAGSNKGTINQSTNNGSISAVLSSGDVYQGDLVGNYEWPGPAGYIGGIAGDSEKNGVTDCTNNGSIIVNGVIAGTEAEWTVLDGTLHSGSFDDGLKAVKNGGSIKLLTDVSSAGVNFMSSAVSVDLNGKTWTMSASISVMSSCTLTVSDSTTGKKGTIIATASRTVYVYEGGTVNLTGGTLLGKASGWETIYNAGKVNINGGNAKNTMSISTVSNADTGTFALINGRVENTADANALSNAGTSHISGGTLSSSSGRAVENQNTGVLYISCGALSSGIENESTIMNSNDIYLSGNPTWNSNGGIHINMYDAQATLTANNGKTGAEQIYSESKVKVICETTVAREGYVVVQGLKDQKHSEDFTFNTAPSGLEYLYDDQSKQIKVVKHVPRYTITASPAEKDFGKLAEDYTAPPAAQTITITNTGNQTMTLTQPASTNFTIGALSSTTIEKDKTATFTIQPKPGLTEKEYNETITVNTGNGTSAAVAVKFTVTRASVYALTVNGSYANATGAGTYEGDAVVNISAGTRSGYTFTGWISSGGGTFADAGSASTTFTMPKGNATITASWRYNGGGGGSSSGGSSSGTTRPQSQPAVSTPGKGEANIPATVDQNGNANISVTDKIITDAITDAKKDAVQGQSITVEIKVNTEKDPSQLTTILPQSVQNALISNQVGTLIIGSKEISMNLSQAALSQMNVQAQGNLSITAAKADTGKLTGIARTLIGNRPAYDFKTTCDGKLITDLGANAVTITIPYILREGETAANIRAVRVDANGVAAVVPNSYYDAAKQSIIFITGDLSAIYGVGYQQAAATTAHRVQRGDTLAVIARRYQTTVQAIIELNSISNPDQIEVGQEIQIP